jgi:PAS domain S-box-containing protein
MTASPNPAVGAGEDPRAPVLLDALFTHAPIGLAFWDRELRYRRVNETLAAMNGLSPEEHVGRTVVDVLGELGRELTTTLRGVLETGEPVLNMEVSGETPAAPGVERFRLASYYPVTDPAGATVGVGAVVQDVTEQRRAEAERVKLTEAALESGLDAEEARATAERARAEAETARRHTEFLARAGARMTASMDYEETLQKIARAAVPVVADWCAITLLQSNGDLLTAVAAHGDPAHEQLAAGLASDEPIDSDAAASIADAIASGQSRPLADGAERVLGIDIPDPLVPHAALVVPLKTPERAVGALTLAFTDPERLLDRDVMVLSEALAARAALALENARLYSERSHIARTLQDSLRPPVLPGIPGLEVASRYRAAGEQNEVGGDFYDVFASGEEVWTVLIGDVSGKGPEAAALTSLARHTLWAGTLRETGLVEGLELLNRALLGPSGAGSRFCTVVVARVCPSDAGGAEIRLSNAGHPPPLILRDGGAVEPVAGHGMLVGAVPDPVFEEQTLRLDPGDVLLLYTDGVTEVRTSDPRLGERRLVETLEGSRGVSAEEIVRRAEEAAVAIQDGEPRDDMALLALRAAPR